MHSERGYTEVSTSTARSTQPQASLRKLEGGVISGHPATGGLCSHVWTAGCQPRKYNGSNLRTRLGDKYLTRENRRKIHFSRNPDTKAILSTVSGSDVRISSMACIPIQTTEVPIPQRLITQASPANPARLLYAFKVTSL